MSNQDKIDRLKERFATLNQISPTLCLAKWTQSTVYLQNGFTHSCHHPPAHKIPLDEIKENPGALHTTKHKLIERQQMMQGLRPRGCSYCWTVEDLPGQHISDRAYKSSTTWAWPSLPDVLEDRGTGIFDPTYLEVSFDSTCNFKCSYCSPEISSKWMEEIRQHGPYPTSRPYNGLDHLIAQDRMPIPARDPNPYVDAFWEWWPTLYPKLHTFRITGGEPLLSRNTWKVFDYVLDHPRTDLVLAVNSNMCVPDKLQDQLLDYANRLTGAVKVFDVFTSVDTDGAQAEYIRNGLDYDQWLHNVNRYLTETPHRMHLMIAFNALSVPRFVYLIERILLLRGTHNTSVALNRLTMMINHVRWPRFLDVRILPDEIKAVFVRKIREVANRVRENPTEILYLEELDQIERLIEYMMSPVDDLDDQRADFAKFIREHDRRRGTNFESTFPELSDFLKDLE